jgi:predicted lipoprotein with Yx(FWY)xxD motif
MRRIALLALVAVAAALAAGCGDEDSDGNSGAGQSDVAMRDESGAAMRDDVAMKSERSSSSAEGRLIKAVGSEYGQVVSDAKGEAFYIFDKESSARSECYGACARAWPPVLTSGRPRAGKGVRGKLLGTTRRTNGKLQVTYDGQPLYYYVDDSPGNILCQNVSEFGGLWLVVSPGGAPVT